MATTPAPSSAATRTDLVTAVLLVVGVTQILTGVTALLFPGGFYDAIAGYPPENEHFIMDLGSWQIALGALAVYGARRPDWRVPLLGFLGLQYALHTIPHIIHVGDSDPSWQGPFGLATMAFGTLVLVGLFLRERAR